MKRLIYIIKKTITFRGKIWPIPTVIFTLLVIFGSTSHPLWSDEAETAFFARNTNTYGFPKGFDGVNTVGSTEAVLLNKNLVNHTSPWLQFYVAALSFRLFGESSFTARLPFLLFSISSIPLMYFLTLKLTKKQSFAFLVCLLASLSVPFILFSYQARYYPLTVFFGLVFVYQSLLLLEDRPKKDKKHFLPKIILVLSSTLGLYSQYISFSAFIIACFFAFLIYLICQKKTFKEIAKSLSLIILLIIVSVLLFLPWFLFLNPSHRTTLTIPNINEIITFLPPLVYKTYEPFQINNSLPILFPPLLLIFLLLIIKRRENISSSLFVVTLLFFYFLTIGIFSLLNRTAVDFYGFYAERYNTIIFPFAIFASALVLDNLRKINRYVFFFVLIFFIFTNLFTLNTPRSFFWEYLNEIKNPSTSPSKQVAEYLKKHAQDGDTAFISLDRNHRPLIFFLGKKIRFVNRINRFNSLVYPKNHSNLPKYIYSFTGKPDWIIRYGIHEIILDTYESYDTFDFRNFRNLVSTNDLQNYYEETVLPIYFSDRSRPEIGFHSFKKIEPTYEEQVFIYHLKKAKSQ